jgi:drug/metabolite transporter, DME family
MAKYWYPGAVPSTAQALALIAAFLSAGATIFIRQGLRGSDPYTGFWVNVVVGSIGFWIAALVTGDVAHVTGAGVAFFVLAGLVGTVAGRLLRFVSIEKVGASIAAALINLYPLVSSLLAILLLGEHVTTALLAGTVVITSGTILLSASGKTSGFKPWQLAFPLLSATCFGVVAILRKLGLSHTGAVMGAAINTTTALVAFAAFAVGSGQRGALACRGRSLACFVAAGVGENVAVFLNIVALGVGAVSVVAPLYATAPLFVLLLSPLFLRSVEQLSVRVALGTLLIVLGVCVITALSPR